MKTLFRNAVIPLLFVSLLWIIEWLQIKSDQQWYEWGIYPRSLDGLAGIITSPFIHGDIEHLLSNSLPLIVVGTGLIYFYKEIWLKVILLIWLMTNSWVWLAARPNYHIGASGLIYGFVCFLFFSGLIRRDTRLMAVSLLVTFLYGSMVWGILPVDVKISWEAHLAGSFAGVITAIYYRKEGPQKPKAQWEIDEENEKLLEAENEHIQSDPDIIIHYDYIEKKEDEGNDHENVNNKS